MVAIPQVRSSAYIPFVNFLSDTGVSIERGCPGELMQAIVSRDPEALVPLHLAHSYLDQSAKRLGLKDLGFLVGEPTRLADLGAFGRHLTRSLTLNHLLKKVTVSFPYYSSAESLWWVRDGDDVHFFHAYRQATTPGSFYAEQCALLLMRDAIRLAAGRAWQPKLVFTPNKEDVGSFQEAFANPEVRMAPARGIAFPYDLLSKPLVWSDHSMSAGCDQSAFNSSLPSDDFADSLKQIIAIMMSEGRCKLDEVSAAVGIHSRSLQRKLSAIEQDYSELLAQVRFETALRLMSDPAARITDIAFELGFSDASNFSRTFRQWTGMKPLEFRRRHFDH